MDPTAENAEADWAFWRAFCERADCTLIGFTGRRVASVFRNSDTRGSYEIPGFIADLLLKETPDAR